MIAAFLNWIGTVALATAPFFIDTLEGKALAIVGLLILSLQAYRLKAYNLILLNLVGVIGYSFAIWNYLA